ncbi:MAG: alpha/beta fold hydrolase [Patescibacteria group bacterium]|jgi:alpha-beta hydrolase superfamily lysophospholipase
MKIVNIKNSRKLNLVGDLYTADSAKIIIMSHGFAYDRHEKENKFDKIAESFNKVGYNVLKYDFSGSGESDDSPLTLANYIADLKSVIKYARENGYKDIILFGASLGGLVSLSAYNEDIKAIVCLAPVSDKVDSQWRRKNFSEEDLLEIKKTGQVMHKAHGFRDKIIIDRQYLLDREEVNQKLLLRNIKCPVLIFHSNDDTYVPLKVSERAVKILGNKGELYFIKDAGHAFLKHLDTVVNKTINWLAKKN